MRPMLQPLRMLTALLAGAVALLAGGPAPAQEPLPRDRAEALFEEYQRLSQTYDPKVADLYSDHARIVNVRKYPGDLPDRALELKGFQYKEMIRRLMPVAKSLRDHSTFSDVRYREENGHVRVEATRFSVLKRYESPYSILVGPDADGEWRILEERSESRP